MSKELEALEFICKILKEKGIDIKWLFKEQYNTIKQRLESIDNAEPSEALSVFRSVELTLKENRFLNEGSWLIDNLNTIKQALLKAQEIEKVLEIINKKCVDIYLLKSINALEEYNKNIGLRGIELTQEEFELLKRYFEKIFKSYS